jgi:hypothetical protein
MEAGPNGFYATYTQKVHVTLTIANAMPRNA